MERINTEVVCDGKGQVEHFEIQLPELSDMQLALVGGGIGEITTY